MKKILSILAVLISASVYSQVSITDRGNYIAFEAADTTYISKPYEVYVSGDLVSFKSEISSHQILYSTVTSPAVASAKLLRDSLIFWSNTVSSLAPSNLTVNDAGNQIVADFGLEVSKGNVTGHSEPIVAASNIDLGLTRETIWKHTGIWSPMSAARTMSIVSTDANDSVGGSGAHSILLTGVDENGAAQVELVLLDGLTPVITTGLWMGINPSLVFAAGSSTYNEGFITITSTVDIEVQTVIAISDALTSALIYHVPVGSSFYLKLIEAAVYKSSGGGADLIVDGYTLTNGVRYNIYEADLAENVMPSQSLRLSGYSKITGGSCIYFEGVSSKAATTARVAFEGVLVAD